MLKKRDLTIPPNNHTGWRDMGKWLMLRKRLGAFIALLALSEGALHAQVIASYDIHPDSNSNLIIWGREPYEISRTGRNKLIAVAARLVSQNAPLLDLDAYISCIRYCDRYASAKLIFGPYSRSENAFSTDTVLCVQRAILRGGWNCEIKKTWTYLRSDGNNSLIAFGTDVSLDAATAIAHEAPRMIAELQNELPSCRRSEIKGQDLSNRAAILSAYHISPHEGPGSYWLDGSCWLIRNIADGKVELVRKGEHEYLY
jgi:hypothetical protein